MSSRFPVNTGPFKSIRPVAQVTDFALHRDWPVETRVTPGTEVGSIVAAHASLIRSRDSYRIHEP
jgi:hypothetical protein